ncbi:MAG TPA: YfcE family phosphodiesterase [Candidatus Limiplasma sp.]|nr:YfcE family phosphodiesterase [Candidatus Limiplasma sp.]
MRLIVFSDTHQNTAFFQRCVQQAMEDGPIDALLHCGDGVRDLDCVESDLLRANPHILLYAVRGNCDLYLTQYPVTEMLELQGVRMMLTHGHTFQVKQGLGPLASAAREMGADVVFFGHTHQATVVKKHGVTLINPGSLTSYAYTETAYLEVLIDVHKNIRENFIKRHLK